MFKGIVKSLFKTNVPFFVRLLISVLVDQLNKAKPGSKARQFLLSESFASSFKYLYYRWEQFYNQETGQDK